VRQVPDPVPAGFKSHTVEVDVVAGREEPDKEESQDSEPKDDTLANIHDRSVLKSE
jgi:hypothetical protein